MANILDGVPGGSILEGLAECPHRQPQGVVRHHSSRSPRPQRQARLRLIKGAYLLGCRVSEIAVIRWKDIEVLSDGGQVHLFGKGSKARTVRVSSDTLELFQSLGRGEADGYAFRVPEERDASLDKRLEMFAGSGDEPLAHVHPHQLRHSHATQAILRGGCIHAPEHPRPFIERDDWSLRC